MDFFVDLLFQSGQLDPRLRDIELRAADVALIAVEQRDAAENGRRPTAGVLTAGRRVVAQIVGSIEDEDIRIFFGLGQLHVGRGPANAQAISDQVGPDRAGVGQQLIVRRRRNRRVVDRAAELDLLGLFDRNRQ